MSKFISRLDSATRTNRSLVCIGLDVDPALMPIPDVRKFNRAIVDATKDLVCAYKPNIAFYEALGLEGLQALRDTVSYIRNVAPDVVLLCDAKRGDIDSTSVRYARAIFDFWDFDAVTVNGYMGGESLSPFFDYADRGVFVVCRSSNPGAQEFQDMMVLPDTTELGMDIQGQKMPLYEWMAVRSSEWNSNGNLGLVVGATSPDQLCTVRLRCPEVPILIPGVGAQGGELEMSVKNGIDRSADGSATPPRVLINSARGIIYADRSTGGFPDGARNAAGKLRDEINCVLEQEGAPW
ncbi:MAG: orotidine-5'-phosphate decarboxylase, partial [Dehalococcoidia bacterium]|nr:orotidine-5'-phosphate decarboxylase [Dehalococcoidia bacterium]